MNVFVKYILSGLSHLPKASLAHIAREINAILAPYVESMTGNETLVAAEKAAFAQLDAMYARIEAGGD